MCRMLFLLVRNEYLHSQLINICNVNKSSLDNGSIFQRYIEITERNLKKMRQLIVLQ